MRLKRQAAEGGLSIVMSRNDTQFASYKTKDTSAQEVLKLKPPTLSQASSSSSPSLHKFTRRPQSSSSHSEIGGTNERISLSTSHLHKDGTMRIRRFPSVIIKQ